MEGPKNLKVSTFSTLPKHLGLREELPITDVVKKQLAQKHRLYYKICRNCGSKNAADAKRCRKCRNYNLRWKKRELGTK